VQLLIMVFAPARVGRVVDLLQRTGSQEIHLAERPQSHEPSLLLRGLMQTPPRPARRSGSVSRASQPASVRPAADVPDRPSPAD
jgi:hypothetical protein